MSYQKSNLNKVLIVVIGLIISIKIVAQEANEYLPNPYIDLPDELVNPQNMTHHDMPRGSLAPEPGGEADIYSELFTIQDRNQVRMLNSASFMGDSIDPNTGVLNFYHTDVSIPGNSNLPVKLSRHLPTNSAPIVPFKHWGLDVPYISGRLGVSWHANKCSEMMPDESNVNVIATHFFGGLTINDGNGYNGFILEPDLNTIPFELPAGYTRVTKDNWLIKCIDLGEGEEGFEALSPDGTKYTFDVFVSREQAPASYNGYIRRTRLHGAMASKVEDRFGNYVTYQYSIRALGNLDNYSTGRIESIKSSDGREITVNYATTDDQYIKSVSVNGRTWEYGYDTKVTGNFTRNYLKTVTRPDGKFWLFTDVDDLSVYTPRLGQEKRIFTIQVQHPEGAIATYDIEDVLRFKPGMDVDITAGNSAVESQYVEYLGVKNKTVSGEGVNYSWTYNYGDSTYGSWEMDGSLPKDTHTTTITTPNSKEEYTFYRWADWQDGKLLKHVIKEKNGALVQTTDNTWRYGDDDWPADSGMIGSIDLDFGNELAGFVEAKSGQQHFLVSKIITENGSTYTTSYPSYNAYGANLVKSESNNFNGKTRYTKHTYNTGASSWLSRFLHTQTEIGTSSSNLTKVSSTEYYGESETGKLLPKYVSQFGQKQKYFEYHQDGNLHNVKQNIANIGSTDSFAREMSYTDYKRGKPQTISVPKRYITGVDYAYREIDDNGWVKSITPLAGISQKHFYSYDDIGGLLSIKRPSGFLDTLFTWSTTSVGSPTRTTQRCTLNGSRDACVDNFRLTATTTFDDLLRPTSVVTTDNDSNTSVYTKNTYNVNNQAVFTSYPSGSVNPSTGFTTTYDALGRQKNVTQYGGGTVTTEYLGDNKIKVTDAGKNINNIQHSTTTTYLAYGAPSYEQATKILSPEDVVTDITIDIYGNITSITQDGPETTAQTETRLYDATTKHLCMIKRNDVGNTYFKRSINGEIIWQAQGISGSTCAVHNATNTQKVTYAYDNLGDQHTISYGDGTPTRTFTLDSSGNIKTFTGGGYSQNYNYNNLNLLEDETLNVDGKALKLDYDYDNLGALSALGYPDETGKVTFLPNAFGQPTQAKRGTEVFAKDASYYPNGIINTFTYGNNVEHKTHLNTRQMPSQLRDYLSNVDKVNLSYEYDNNGNITKLTNTRDGGSNSLTNLTYDGLDRLVKTIGGSNIGSSSLTYDGLGNIKTYSNTGIDPQNLVYSYANNLLTGLTGNGSSGYSFSTSSYDSRGNVINNGKNTFEYNLANQMVCVDKATTCQKSYVYDGFNRRIKQTKADGKIEYSMYSQSGNLLYSETSDGGINYMFLGSKLIAKEGYGVIAPDTSKNETSIANFKPFGENIETTRDTVGYTGHKFDKALGLNYMQARYYDPVIGRFYSNDPMGSLAHLSKGNIHGFNRYAYANNNPYRYTDPDGRESLGVLIGNWLSGKSLKESAQSTQKTNMAMAKGAKEALSFTKGGLVVDVVETTNEVLNNENIADNVAGMSAGEIAGAVTEKVVEKKLGKEATEVVSAVVGKFSGDAAKDSAAQQTENQNNQEKEVQEPLEKERQ